MDSRAALAREAIEAMVLELRYGTADSPDAPGAETGSTVVTEPVLASDDDTTSTALAAPRQPARFVGEPRPAGADEAPLFGLHNRDYPSLWAAGRLCDMTEAGPISFEPALRDLVSEAWDLGHRLAQYDGKVPGKPSALFPTNREKPQAAESAFTNFAIGSVVSDGEGNLSGTGPLFAWKILGIAGSDDGASVGITEAGYSLLRDMAGLAVTQPHTEEHAMRFLGYIREHAAGDRRGFEAMLRAVGNGVTRPELIEIFSNQWPNWTPTEAATNAAGYIARGREWGFVEPAQVEGLYLLTDLGKRLWAETDQ